MRDEATDTAKRHPHDPAVRFDGGDMDCGNGLLLQIRRRIDPLDAGQLLEILSTEPSVADDLPSWCRMTGNELVSTWNDRDARRWSFLVSKGRFAPVLAGAARKVSPVIAEAPPRTERSSETKNILRTEQGGSTAVAPLSACGIGSWPRPDWLLRALHERLKGRLEEAAFEALADRAVAEGVRAQVDAGVELVTDGEQRRDSYASFVGGRLENCQLIPIVDLLPYVEHPDEFAHELRALDVPAESVRHPAVFGRLKRNPARPLAVHELEAVRRHTDRSVKIALPGPYLLTRTMWLECVSDRVYQAREELADDVVRVLREEVDALLAAGAALVQLDEPVLTEVVHSRQAGGNRSFMCGALGEKRPPAEELEFARSLLARTLDGFPRERLALHVCRGNWTRDESAALAGDYRPLIPLFSSIPVGTLFLELCTPRSGEIEVLGDLPRSLRIGVGVVDQKSERIETPEVIVARAERAIALFGPDRVLLNPDCGFATFADSPISAFGIARAKLAALVASSRVLRERHGMENTSVPR
jgi:5-methyltetrahydropteroyltriglutamate--homocysteine methyltransferase